MRILRDLAITNLYAFKKANKLMAEHHLLMYVGLIYAPFLWLMLQLAPAVPLFSGMIEFLAYALVLSNYFYLINRATAGYKTDWQDVKDGFSVYTRKVFGILFVFWIILYGIDILGGMLPLMVLLILKLVGYLAVFIFFNALPETIYKKDYAELDSMRYALTFSKVNWLDWYGPNLVLFFLNWLVWKGMSLLSDMFLATLPSSVQDALSLVVVILVLQFTLGYTMLYRGLLFTRLDTTTRQKRLFQAKP